MQFGPFGFAQGCACGCTPAFGRAEPTHRARCRAMDGDPGDWWVQLRIMLKRLGSKYLPMILLVLSIVAILCLSRYAGGGMASWVETFAWPNGVTVCALLLTLVVIAWQSTEARDAAKASLMQANYIVTSERAWMISNITQPSPQDVTSPHGKSAQWYLPIQVTFTNRGKSPAIALRGSLEYSSEQTTGSNGMTIEPDLPKIVTYTKEARKIAPGTVYVTDGTTYLIVTIPRDFLLQEQLYWISAQKCLCVKGFFEYRDVFNETHITRFCFAYQITQVGGGFKDETTGEQIFPPGFAKAGPDAYNEVT